jgi:hypothetical protein
LDGSTNEEVKFAPIYIPATMITAMAHQGKTDHNRKTRPERTALIIEKKRGMNTTKMPR